jgi:hypothetical protein
MRTHAYFIFFLLTSNPNFALAEFLNIQNLEERSIFIEEDSISHHGSMVNFWSLINHTEIQTEINDKYLSSKGQWEIDCTKKLARQLFHAIYSGQMGGGETIWSGPLSQKLTPIIPGSIGDSIYKHVCT